MGRLHQDLTGMRFGRVTCLKWVGMDRHHNSIWRCKCDCGVEFNAFRQNLINGNTRSCGCLRAQLLRDLHAQRRAAV